MSNKRFVTVTINIKLDLGIYNVMSAFGDDKIILENITLKVIQKINNYTFNHHYFVLTIIMK